MINKGFSTKAIRTQIANEGEQEHSSPIYMTSSFTFDNAEQMRAAFADEIDQNIYSRFVNPNHSEFEEKMALLEGVESAHSVASGMAAMFACFGAFLSQGDHLLACRSIFGSTHTVITKYLPKWGIEHTYLDINDQDNWESFVQENTKMMLVETPSNPALGIVDLKQLGEWCNRRGILLLVDNCFATPYIQQPARFGADLICHSATKYIDGQGRGVGGVVCGSEELINEVRAFARSTGPSLSPFNSWMFSKSLETLSLRMRQHSSNALELAKFLEEDNQIEEVYYPGLPSHPSYKIAKQQMKTGGGIVSFVIKGGVDAGRQFLDALKISSITANLGDSRTITTHPASTTHAKLSEEERINTGIVGGLIRISVGLEEVEDIIEDIQQALSTIK